MMIDLTDTELSLLDGNVASEKAQALIDAAKARLAAVSRMADVSPHIAALVADVLTEANESGKLAYYSELIRYCSYCKSSPNPRHVPYKSGPRKGQPNWDKPRYLKGFEFAHRFVRVRHHVAVGGCQVCVSEAMPYLIEELVGVPVQLPPQLHKYGTPRYVKYPHRSCTCGWTGHEGQMGRLTTMLGDGTYPATCPSCGRGGGFGDRLDHADGYTMVEMEA